MGYIIGNLLKHKEITKFEDLKENPFSSYSYIASKYGDKFAQNLVYSVINIDEDSHSLLDINQFKEAKASAPSAKAG